MQKKITKPKRIQLLEGIVVRNFPQKDKTISVLVETVFFSPKERKEVKRKKIFHTHDPFNQAKLNDRVVIRKTRRFSKQKSFLLFEIKK